jgi:putative chitinase
MSVEDFEFDFTLEQVEDMLKGNSEAEEWYDAMCHVLPQYNITTEARVAAFIAQCGHESNNFKVLSENLNYSADALDKIFPKYFKNAGRHAQDYHREPEEIANVIYANRMDNGDTDSGDGWTFRGGGILQLTGRANYTAFGNTYDMSAEEATEYVREKNGALASACWYWETNKLNRYADTYDMKTLTKRINGGYIGLEDRVSHYEHAMEVLGGHYNTFPPVATNETLRRTRPNMTGPTVQALQEALGISPADGVFGFGTEKALTNWQAENGLSPDGVAGPITLGKILG